MTSAPSPRSDPGSPADGSPASSTTRVSPPLVSAKERPARHSSISRPSESDCPARPRRRGRGAVRRQPLVILFICLWSFSSRQLAWCHSLLSSAAQPPGECPSSLFLSCPDLKGGLHRLHQRRASAVHNFIGRPFVPLRMRDAHTTPVLPEVSRRISNFDGAAEPPQSGIPCPPPAVFPNGGPKIYTKFVSECEMPTDHGVFRLRSYQHIAPDKQFDIVVMINGDLKGGMDVPVRVHDQCMTSEALGSKRCDCKDQLDMAMEYVGRNNGAVIYLQQEGRGIGLANKIAAYALQDRGMDTVDANRHLGFEDDTRSYESVPFILRDIGVESIVLMTNNPRKVKHLIQLGVNIEGIIPLRVSPNDFNRKYLETKSQRMMHVLPLEDWEDLLYQTKKAKLDIAEELDLAAEGIQLKQVNNHKSPPDDSEDRQLSNHHEPEQDADDDRPPSTTGGSSFIQLTDPSIVPNKRPPSRKCPDDPQSGDKPGLPCSSPAAASVAPSAAPRMTVQVYHGVDLDLSTKRWRLGRTSVEEAIRALREGGMVIVTDDEKRENEGDLIMAAEKATPEDIAFMVRHTSGVLCVPMEGSRLDALNLPPMRTHNQDPRQTAFSLSCDIDNGSTGISSRDRALTIRRLADPSADAGDFIRPGHVFPLRYRDGGVFTRGGHTEASVDLTRLAGLQPVSVIGEIVSARDPTDMARMDELKDFARRHGLVMTTIEDLICYRIETEYGIAIPDDASDAATSSSDEASSPPTPTTSTPCGPTNDSERHPHTPQQQQRHHPLPPGFHDTMTDRSPSIRRHRNRQEPRGGDE
ncbi:unnamed protein product [Vitrella brassicaformis CCMP3155]|uniref:GTP cyclohydrolase II n=2 Tax=Vitrella brassicaformis TaxID=1169539 RepID=A0A0G4H3K7_VITBC|nr:unnamed protein product [Vitrella brassicaformis CCMP3155]|eukprot:CEM38204.1 unnamed protein product [Vitrella brassicaformis CCMP3155]